VSKDLYANSNTHRHILGKQELIFKVIRMRK